VFTASAHASGVRKLATPCSCNSSNPLSARGARYTASGLLLGSALSTRSAITFGLVSELEPMTDTTASQWSDASNAERIAV
jgi:hypothetical protein